MSINDDRQLSQEERAEIAKRKLEMEIQKKTKRTIPLGELKKELGIAEKSKKK